jgi:hypothetical protein
MVSERPLPVKVTTTWNGPELWTPRLYPSKGVAVVKLIDEPLQATVTAPPAFENVALTVAAGVELVVVGWTEPVRDPSSDVPEPVVWCVPAGCDVLVGTVAAGALDVTGLTGAGAGAGGGGAWAPEPSGRVL